MSTRILLLCLLGGMVLISGCSHSPGASPAAPAPAAATPGLLPGPPGRALAEGVANCVKGTLWEYAGAPTIYGPYNIRYTIEGKTQYREAEYCKAVGRLEGADVPAGYSAEYYFQWDVVKGNYTGVCYRHTIPGSPSREGCEAAGTGGSRAGGGAPPESRAGSAAVSFPPEVAACLKQAMGEVAFSAFTEGRRPPTSVEEALIGRCYSKSAGAPGGPPGAGGPAAGGGASAFSWENPPRFVKHSFIELDRIEKISKFRSGYGHDFSHDSAEAGGCRSMKHYYQVKGWEPGSAYNPSGAAVKYFAPVDGTVTHVITSATPSGEEARFDLQSDEYPGLYLGFFHVRLLDSIKEGTRVTAGQHIGAVAGDAHGEIAVKLTYPITPSGWLSFFDVVDDSVFGEYKKRGASSRQEFIITKEQREKNPLTCDSTWEKRFTGARDTRGLSFHLWQDGPDNWVALK